MRLIEIVCISRTSSLLVLQGLMQPKFSLPPTYCQIRLSIEGWYLESILSPCYCFLRRQETELPISLIHCPIKKRLEKLLEGESGNDALLELIWNNIGDYHFDRQSWDKAVVYYSKAKKCEKLAECFYALGDWDSLGEMVTTLHEGSPLLPTLAKKFFHAGICKHAVSMSPSNPTWCFTLFNFNLSSVKACACTFNCIPLTKLLVKSAKSS